MPFNNTVIQITREGMGSGPQELQHKLLKTYLTLLLESGSLPNALLCYTDGVKLLTAGSAVEEELRELEARGVRLVVCSTCVNFYGIQDQISTGIIGGMTDIMAAQQAASKVITL